MTKTTKVSCGENLQGKIVCAVFEYTDLDGEVYPKFIRLVNIEDIKTVTSLQNELNKIYGTKTK